MSLLGNANEMLLMTSKKKMEILGVQMNIVGVSDCRVVKWVDMLFVGIKIYIGWPTLTSYFARFI